MNNLVILGAGKPLVGDSNPAIRKASYNIKVTDWILHTTAFLVDKVTFVAGYQVEEIVDKYPDFTYVTNHNWHNTGAAESLLLACGDINGEVYVSYGDIVYRKSLVKKIATSDADVSVAIDKKWKQRYANRTAEDIEICEKVCLTEEKVHRLGSDIPVEMASAEFIGFLKFSPQVIEYLKNCRPELPKDITKLHLSGLIEFLRMKGFDIQVFDAAGDWAELNEPADLAHFVMGTKAQTLKRLQSVVHKSRIEDQVSFTVSEWRVAATQITQKIQEAFNDNRLVVRSSALSEDGFSSANAGAYTSVLRVDCSQLSAIQHAVEEVISSYPDNNPANQVLVQPMVNDVVASGVAFTRTLDHGAPYYVINYDDVTRSTESITSGASREHKTLLMHRNSLHLLDAVPDVVKNLIPAMAEIESLLDFDSLDIEFAISQKGRVHILQVRPIAVLHELKEEDDSNIQEMLAHAVARFEDLQTSTPFVVGKSAYFGVMPDWNPAEIIGTKPSRMSISLYKELIMDSNWATQRAEYGYRDVRPQPLLTSFAGHPYVDIRASFNSFVPANLGDSLATRLVDFYLKHLAENPHLHDKVEFDVVPTCYGLDFDRWKTRLTEKGGFSLDDISQLENGLKSITRNAFKRTTNDLSSISILKDRFEKISTSNLPPLNKALVLLEDCKRYGTLVFAHLARSAFVAVTLLKSAVNRNIITQAAADSFLGSIRTVTHQFTENATDTALGNMSWEDFVTKYGHLRPGTYDISSPCYRDDPEHFLVPIVERAKQSPQSSHVLDSQQWDRVKADFLQALVDEELVSSSNSIEQFMRDAIEGREYAKFIFSRNLSAALDCLVVYGESLGLSRDDLSYIDIADLMHCQSGTGLLTNDGAQELKRLAELGKATHKLTSTIELPPLITQSSDFCVFLYPNTEANFVGSGKIRSECVDLQLSTEANALNLSGKIALIPQADPGYDWLFGQNIAGLITMYGGANSHMAIRSAEFGLPAAIGVGETKYASLALAQVLELDAGNRRIQVIR
ncbi:PEP-utilizing enzyme [Marinomonas algicola]|uniref:PEP-utilizing enzyme n=1 Tax=Marinomonas algicola TaxID=2773454 RepID=UPI001748E192|nr:PEP-utilizing enzyme [Marinomonas algicola]